MTSMHSSGDDETRQYNIVLIMTDQQPVSTLGCYGNPHNPTPNLDKIATQGLRFDNCYIAGFPCSPSRGSLLSGRYPHSHGVVYNDVLFEPEVPSLGNILTAAGYDMAYFGKWHLGGQMDRDIEGRERDKRGWALRPVPSEEGFRFEKVEGAGGEDEPQHGFTAKWVGGWEHYQEYLRKVGLGGAVDGHPNMGNHSIWPSGGDDEHCYSQVPEEHHVEAFIAKEAVKFIKSREGNSRPSGIVVSFYAPHLPVAPPKPWDTLFSLDEVALPDNHNDTMEGKALEVRYWPAYMLDKWTEEQFKDYIRRYWGYCAYIDKQVGAVLQALTDAGREDDTIVIFTSDHGDMVAAHGMVWKWDHCGYEELFRVPLLIRGPEVTAAGRSTPALVSSIDLLPTLLELIGVASPEGIQGRSMVPLLSGQQDTFRERIFCDSIDTALVTYDGRWKYVLSWLPRDIDELYDLQNDAGELHNLANDPEYQYIVSQMREHIFNWLDETNHPYAEVIRRAAEQPVSLSDYPKAPPEVNLSA